MRDLQNISLQYYFALLLSRVPTVCSYFVEELVKTEKIFKKALVLERPNIIEPIHKVFLLGLCETASFRFNQRFNISMDLQFPPIPCTYLLKT